MIKINLASVIFHFTENQKHWGVMYRKQNGFLTAAVIDPDTEETILTTIVSTTDTPSQEHAESLLRHHLQTQNN